MTITEEDIQALLDNELSAEDEQKIALALQANPELMKRYLYLRQQKKILKLWWSLEKEKTH